MKKLSLWFALSLFSIMQLSAQSGLFKVQGIPRPDLRQMGIQKAPSNGDPYDYAEFNFDDIQFWVGTGTNRAALIIDWYDGKGEPTAMVWGYRWHNDSIRTGLDMVKAIARTDKRFLYLTHVTDLGNTIAGLGYDLNGNGEQSLIYNNETSNPIYPIAGTVATTQYDYDDWVNSDPDDHWRAGWYNGYWSYQTKEAGDSSFDYSGLGASSRVLQDGSCDGWGYMDFAGEDMSGTLPRMPFIPASVALRINSIQLEKEELTLSIDESVKIVCSVNSDESIQPLLHWSSNDPKIATVDQEGAIKAISVGTTQIVVTETDTRLSKTCTVVVAAPKTKYTNGVFFVNEDWYGHNNSTINFLDDNGNWHYRVYQNENIGKELGGTSQFGTIYGDKLFIISKQDKDPGASIQGSRLAVCNAETMESLAEFPRIGNSDGRSFVGVNEHKGYIGTSSGIYLFDIDNLTVGDQLKGTENLNGSLYNGQIGTMIQTAGKVFAVSQQNGLMVIDAESDEIQQIIAAPKDGTKQRGFGSIVQSKDGNLWLSVATNTSGSGEEYLLKLNPHTLDTIRVNLPKGAGVPNSWYAWTADGFCSSTQHNKLYWKNNGGWFSSTTIFEYDIDENLFRTVFDCSANESTKDWGIIGAGFRLDPTTDEIYTSLFKSFGEPIYKVAKINPINGTVIADYPMENGYWFPAMPVFPDRYAPVVSDELTDILLKEETTIYLGDKVADVDNFSAAIVKSIISISDPNIFTAIIRNDNLIITPKAGQSGVATLKLQFNSNGKCIDKICTITVEGITVDIEATQTNQFKVYPTATSGLLTIKSDQISDTVQILDIFGRTIETVFLQSAESAINISSYSSGIYLIKSGDQTVRVVKR